MIETYLEVATEAAKKAGEVLLKHWGQLYSIQEKGRSGDLVTEADKASEMEILNQIKTNFPDHQILTEESGILGEETPFLWVIDPLDGTTNYAHQFPCFCVSIALLIDKVPQIGVIYNPFYEELFQGAKNLGATLNQIPITVSNTTKLSQSLLVTGFAYDRRETKDNNYAEFCRLTHLTQGVRRTGSAALDLAYVAAGRFDGYWERGLKLWDIAAGIIMVEEAGGRISAYNNTKIDLGSGRILATNGKIHEILSQELIQTTPLTDWYDPDRLD